MTLPAATRSLAAGSSNRSGGAKHVKNDVGRSTAKAPTAGWPAPTAGGQPRRGWGISAVTETNKAMQQLRTMGFDDQACRQALDQNSGDVNAALDWLLTNAADVANDVEEASSQGVEEDVRSTTAASSISSPATAEIPAPDAVSEQAASVHDENADSTDESTRNWETLLGDQDTNVESSIPDVCDLPTTAGIIEEAAETVAPIVQKDVSPAAPRKQLLRCFWEWPRGLPGNQLGVTKGDFVNVWVDTRTEVGWIYAERPNDSSDGGWLPFEVLEEPPAEHEWMRSTLSLPPICERQLNILEGNIYLVHEASFHAGWVYAEETSSQKDSADIQGGWVPEYCFESDSKS